MGVLPADEKRGKIGGQNQENQGYREIGTGLGRDRFLLALQEETRHSNEQHGCNEAAYAHERLYQRILGKLVTCFKP